MATVIIGPAGDYATWELFQSAQPTKPAIGDTTEWQTATPGVGTLSVLTTITVPRAGTPTQPIILRARSGDNILIDGQNTRQQCISCAYGHIIIDGFSMDKTKGAGGTDAGTPSLIAINGGSSPTTGIIVQNCSINLSFNNPTGTNDIRGITAINGAHGLSILNNRFTTDTGSYGPGETDCILIGYGGGATTGLVVRGNTFTMRNQTTNPTGHNDCLQTLNCTDMLIERNVMSRPVTTAGGQGQAVYLEWYNRGSDVSVSDYGTGTFRNNLVYGHGAGYLFQTNPRQEPNTKDPTVAIVVQNNIFDALDYAGTLGCRFTHGNTWVGGSLVFQNNIVVVRLSSGTIYAVEINCPYTGGNLTCDYNHYYAPSAADSSEFRYNGAGYNYADFRTAVGATHGIGYTAGWIDPLFNNAAGGDYTLSTLSPDIGVGVTLPDFSTDLNGALRTVPWTIGCYIAQLLAGLGYKRLGRCIKLCGLG